MPSSPALLAVTWIVWWVGSVGVGWLLARRRTNNPAILGWFGLFAITAISLILALIVPLGSLVARSIGWLVLVLGLVAFVWAGLWRRWRLIFVVAFVAALAALMSSVIPSNYDLGLYHAGSIAYVREGGTVIGLANLHDRFGFSSSMWPLSAFLGLGVWNGSEFRLVNGLVLVLITTDVVTRIRAGHLRRIDTLVVAIGSLLLVGAVLQYPGRLIASSAQDWTAAALIIVSASYLSRVLIHRTARWASTAAIVTAAMAGAMRPIGWIYALVTVLIVLAVHEQRGGWKKATRALVPGVVAAAVLAIANALRDALTSGWLFFPVGFVPVPVSWRYPDPGPTSQDITAWARTPFQDPARTLADNSWIPGWLARLPTDWAVFSALVLGALVLVWLIVSSKDRARFTAWRRFTVISIAPSVAVLVVWLIFAPDPRFAWGPIVLLPVIPLAVLFSITPHRRLLSSFFIASAILVVALAVARGSLFDVSLRLEPLPQSGVTSGSLSDGTQVRIPLQGDRCWGEFPLCRPWYLSVDVELRGDSWRSGFQPISRFIDNHE